MATTRKTSTSKTTPAKATVKTEPKPKPAPSNCGCGCGQPTITTKATFLAGHDARHAGNLGRALAAEPTDKALKTAFGSLTPALQVKVERIRQAEAKRLAERAAKKAAREAAKAAYAATLKQSA